MPQSVAVPEKTLEHWSSQYILSRYPYTSMWWPATGQDIDLGCLPARPGKAIQLELKTITVVEGTGIYDVLVDLGQLCKYLQNPPGEQPFYVFPWPQPSWNGILMSIAAGHGVPASELGFARSLQVVDNLWFANWLVVLTARQVAAMLQQELDAHGCTNRKKIRLVRFVQGKPTWGSKLRGPRPPDPEVFEWLDFWPELMRCGRAGWPQLIRLPRWVLPSQGSFSLPEVSRLLQRASNRVTSMEDSGESFVTLQPGANGEYQLLIRDPDSALNAAAPAGAAGAGRTGSHDYRALVFVDAQGLTA